MIQSIDNKGNTFHMMKPALMMDSSTPLHVIEGSIETHSNKNGNQSVSIRYIRKPHNIQVSNKQTMYNKGHFETNKSGKLNIVVKHSELLKQRNQPKDKVKKIKTDKTKESKSQYWLSSKSKSQSPFKVKEEEPKVSFIRGRKELDQSPSK